MKLKQRHGIVSPIEQLRRGVVPAAYTIKEMARKLKVDPSWFSRKIAEGAIRITKDAKYQCYLFPRTKHSIEQLKRLKKGVIPHVSFQSLHHDG